MPFPRGKKPTTSKIPKLNTNGPENQLDGLQTKRSSSSPQGAPKKRTAFVDITNAHKIELSNPIKKKDPIKKLQKKASVFAKNDGTLKKSVMLSSEEQLQELKNVESPVEKQVEPCSKASIPPHLLPPQIPPEFDIDSEHLSDSTHAPEYAKDIFDYLKSREEKFILHDYMAYQPNLNSNMRAILVDWLVEVQENFELNHETLYLAVKITDHYLAVTQAKRESLQLIGSTAMLIASKFECVNAGMDTLTLSRFICELSLLEMEFVPLRASLLASACLLIALVTKDLGGWTPCLQFHSGYNVEDLVPVVRKLHHMLSSPPDSKLAIIRSKYAHKVFFEVALIPTVNLQKLEGFLK
ncbi:G2/mitotic-specific cyclin-B3-like isoform X2 [Myxocyprinus asiaticus]|uniref:G2/mitotic-specific cyclin-B3-like isoform X2 n=1 Tax=Myxocyprinus asiaticus TaxID=70543 RepID=UPI0022224967|nr:G2/mitotic-specific cyclin-B3-like isoform X2 [Myxocyprinus asiaticus]